MKRMFFTVLLFISSNAYADLEYCSGTIKELITRNSHEATYVALETSSGVSGRARIGDENGYNDFQKMQMSMLMAAYMAKEEVYLELATNGYTFVDCTNFQTGLPVRFVRFK